jgi:hypothetical protein
LSTKLSEPKDIDLPGNENWDPEKSEKVIELIGEPLLQKELRRMHDEAFRSNLRLETAERRKAEIELEIEELRNEIVKNKGGKNQ